jgi:hypothetical protein
MEAIVKGTSRDHSSKIEELWTDKDNFNLEAASLQEPNPFDVFNFISISPFRL